MLTLTPDELWNIIKKDTADSLPIFTFHSEFKVVQATRLGKPLSMIEPNFSICYSGKTEGFGSGVFHNYTPTLVNRLMSEYTRLHEEYEKLKSQK